MAVPHCSCLSSTHWALLRASRIRTFRPKGTIIQRQYIPPSHFPKNPPSSAGGDAVGFAFDIDGVLLRGRKPIPGARAALEKLKAQHIPFVLLTNGGGKHEIERAQELSELLQTPIPSEILIQSHTPFQQLVHTAPVKLHPALKDECVLVIGGEGNSCRDIAEKYGFQNVVTPADIVTASLAIWPFANLDLYRPYARPLPKPICPGQITHDKQIHDYLTISAVLVFHDSRDWGLDTQLILDVMGSYKGCIGTRMARKNRDKEIQGWEEGIRPLLIFSNPDKVWQSEFEIPRLGQGALRSAVRANFHNMVDELPQLKDSVGGKPSSEQFAFAHERLLNHHQTLLNNRDLSEKERKGLGRVYMIGDNPASDITGANRYTPGSPVPWFPILTRTGVYDERKGSSRATDVAVTVADNVSAAVDWALKDSHSARTMDLRPWGVLQKLAKRYYSSRFSTKNKDVQTE